MTFLRQGYGGQGVLVVGLLMVASTTFAQQAPALRPHHLTINLGVVASGGYDIGSATAHLRGNGLGAQTSPFTFFTADSRVTRVAVPEFRLGVALSRTVGIDVGGSQSNPRVGVAIKNDAEAPAQQLPGEELQQYVFDGAVTWQLPFARSRVAPFVLAGGGYLRQLHEERTLGESGQIYYAGGGARYWLRGGDRSSKAIGLRGDLRVNLRRNGIDFAGKMRAFPTVSVSFFVGL